MSYLRLQGIRKTFGQSVALDDIDLTVERGELVSFLGPSGCGKTTTLRIVAGFERADRGSVFVDGRDLSNVPPERRGMGMVFQTYGLFPNMTVTRNIAFGLRVAGRDARETRARVEAMLDLIGLPDIGQRYPNQLSGGQQQRVALARAIAIEPRVLLLDEPLSALDAVVRASLRTQIRDIQQQTGITAIYVTHDQEEALTISDRVVVLNHGRIDQIGSPREVYERPASAFVAGFIGSANRLEGHVLDASLGVVRVGDDLVRIPPDAVVAAGGDVLIVVRPERLVIRPTDATQVAANRLLGVVRGVTYLGPTDSVAVEVAGRRLIATVPAGGIVPGPGAAVAIEFAIEHCHVVGTAGSAPMGQVAAGVPPEDAI
jgi:putative spermidine/putrescine transport system ATP-binding protein